MSAISTGDFAGALNHRSSTPAPNEKVLLYLESLPRHSEYMSPISRPPSMFREEPRQLSQHGWDEEEGEGEPDSPMIYGVVNVNGVNGYSNGEDVESNFQEGIHSRMGDAIPIQSTGMVHEPSPNDAPGPRYESYGSSFGNMGPLPGTFFKTSSKHSRRAPSEDDGATVTQDDQPHSTKTPSRTRTRSLRSVDKSLSPRSQPSVLQSQKSRGSMKSIPRTPSAQKLKSVSSTGDMRRAPLNGRSQAPVSIIANPHYSHLQNGATKKPSSEAIRTPRIRVQSPSVELDPSETQLIKDVIASRRSSYALPPSTLEPEVAQSHFHDMDLCILLHQMDDYNTHDVVKKALRKAVRQRVKRLGMKYDTNSIKQYRNSFHDHDPEVHLQPNYQPTMPQEPPEWAKTLMAGMNLAHERFDGLDQKIESLKSPRGGTFDESRFTDDNHFDYATPRTQTVGINTAQPTGYTMAESMYPGNDQHYGDEDGYTEGIPTIPDGDTRTHGAMSEINRDDSPGQQYLEEELYKLRQRPGGSQSATHKTWELGEATRDGMDDFGDGETGAFTESGLPEMLDASTQVDRREMSLPPIPEEEREDSENYRQSLVWVPSEKQRDEDVMPPWQRIHQRILSWATIWPLSGIDDALKSTNRGSQVDETALSIWSTQSYKRYVRSRMTDSPNGRVDRLFVPPNIADAISTAVFHGQHGDACGMLRDLWVPFGLERSPRLIIVLAKHRADVNHWVVHRFSLNEGTLTTYDTFPERTLPDGRPLGWWFAIRAAWPDVVNHNPDRLTQKIVRLHRPMLLGVDNSVAAGGIWRNILMGSRAERSLDLQRLRDLINTEVKNLRQRKVQGKLSLTKSPVAKWDDMR